MQEPRQSRYESIVNEDGPKEVSTKNLIFRQIIANTGPVIFTLSNGFINGFSAILLPQLNQKSSSIKVNPEEESWIAALVPMPLAVGSLFGGWWMEQCGRKLTNVFASLLVAIGWILIYYSSDLQRLCLGRAITGFGCGAGGLAVLTYVGEISHPKARGVVLNMLSLVWTVGLLGIHILGMHMEWTTIALLNVVVALVALVAFANAPDSHVWYANENMIRRAKATFYWFRGRSRCAKDELVKVLDEEGNVKYCTLAKMLEGAQRSEFMQPFLIVNILFATSQATGSNAVAFYTVTIVQSMMPTIDKYMATMIIDAVRIVFTLLSCVWINYFNLRPLVLFSGFSTAGFLYLLSLSIFFKSTNPENEAINHLPLIFLAITTATSNIALINIPFNYCAEIFPKSLKGLGAGVSTFINFFVAFVVIKTCPSMFAFLGSSITFAIYACLTLIGTVVLLFILPETRNRTLSEIEASFRSDSDVMTVQVESQQYKKNSAVRKNSGQRGRKSDGSGYREMPRRTSRDSRYAGGGGRRKEFRTNLEDYLVEYHFSS